MSELSSASPSANAVSPALIARETALTCSLVMTTGTEGMRDDLGRKLLDFLIQFVERHDTIDEAHRFGLLRREWPAGHDQFLGHRRADLAHQSRNATPGQRNAEFNFGNRETRVFSGNAQVAGRGQHHASTDNVAVQTNDSRCAHLFDGVGHASSVLSHFTAIEPRFARIGHGFRRWRFLRSAPAQKARPAPLTMTTRTSRCSSNQRAASTSSRSIVALIAFNRSGRLSVSPSERTVDFNVDCRKFHLVHSLRYKVHPNSPCLLRRTPHRTRLYDLSTKETDWCEIAVETRSQIANEAERGPH